MVTGFIPAEPQIDSNRPLSRLSRPEATTTLCSRKAAQLPRTERGTGHDTSRYLHSELPRNLLHSGHLKLFSSISLCSQIVHLLSVSASYPHVSRSITPIL
jgi:hypothetical protein